MVYHNSNCELSVKVDLHNGTNSKSSATLLHNRGDVSFLCTALQKLT